MSATHAANHAVVWIDHRHAQVMHIEHERDALQIINAAEEKEHLHHRANAVGDGKSRPHPEYFRNVIAAVGASKEILVVGPSGAKTELLKFAKQHAKDFAQRVGKIETLGRISTGEQADYARHFFGMNKPRLMPYR